MWGVGAQVIEHRGHVFDPVQGVRVGVDLVIGKSGCFPSSAVTGGPMARRTFDVIHLDLTHADMGI